MKFGGWRYGTSTIVDIRSLKVNDAQHYGNGPYFHPQARRAPLQGRSQWPAGLTRVSAAVRLLGLWVQFLPGHGVCRECCVLSGRGSATSWSLVQRSPTECAASCVTEKPQDRGGLGSGWARSAIGTPNVENHLHTVVYVWYLFACELLLSWIRRRSLAEIQT